MTYNEFIDKVESNEKTSLYEFDFMNKNGKVEVVNNDTGAVESYESVNVACHVFRNIITRACQSNLFFAKKQRITFGIKNNPDYIRLYK